MEDSWEVEMVMMIMKTKKGVLYYTLCAIPFMYNSLGNTIS